MGLHSHFLLLLEIRSVWSYILTLHTFSCYLIKHRDIFTCVVKSAIKKITVFWDVMLCTLLLHLQDRRTTAWRREQTVLKASENKERG
jgi:hypothetical protein